MSFFDLPGSMEAISEWNAAREAHVAADDALKKARDRRWQTLVRLAKAHKHAVDAAGSEYADMFMWLDGLYGNRDTILETVPHAGPNA